MTQKQPRTVIFIPDQDDDLIYSSIEELVDSYDGDVKGVKVLKYKLESTGYIEINPTFKVKSMTK
jgi:hypothetical protein